MKKRKGAIIHQHCARHHISYIFDNQELSRGALMHPRMHSTDLAPSDSQSFRFLEIFLPSWGIKVGAEPMYSMEDFAGGSWLVS